MASISMENMATRPVHPDPPNVAPDTNPEQEPSSRTLLENIDESTRRQVAERYFGILTDNGELSFLKPYFDFYNRELKRLRVGITPLISGLPTKTHTDLMHTQKIIFDSRTEVRSVVRERVRPILAMEDDLSLDRMVDLTIRLWLMVNVRDDSLSMSLWRPQQFSARWDESESLDKFLAHHFPTSTTKLERKQSRLETTFTAAYMVRTCRLQLKWTDDLVNHLRLERGPDAKTLSIFPHKAFLVAHLKNGRNTVLPQQLVRETIMSLNMLFPQWDQATQALLREHGQIFDSVSPFEGPRKPSLQEFSYWRDHLEDLHDVFQAEPDSWFQLFFDRRNPQQWWTFWIALVVFVLSVASLGTSIAQVVISQKALELQRLSM